jgi:hypothetical protein
MIDRYGATGTMPNVEREDRALLRSNPSARLDAGTWTGASLNVTWRLPPLNMFWLRSEKPRGAGGRAPDHALRAVCHLARSTGRRNEPVPL